MYGMGLGISVWDGSRGGYRDWCMLEGPLTETLNGSSFEGPPWRGHAPVCLLIGGVEFSFFYTKYGLIFCALC